MTLAHFAIVVLSLIAPPAPAGGGDAADPQRLVTLLDYIGSDYAGAVANGIVVSELEYEEQREFIRTAHRIAKAVAGQTGDSLTIRIAALEARIDAKAEPDEVARLCRSSRDEVVRRFGLATAPDGRPSLTGAQRLFGRSCAGCHGETGDGKTALAATLDPAPANFKDADRLAVLSPYRVFNTLTYGVPGTAMAPFPGLSIAERWSLAFYVFRLGHAGRPTEASPTLPLAELAGTTDAELRRRIAAERGTGDVERTLAFQRREAPFVEPSASAGIATARDFLARASTAYREGRPDEAERALVDAYLRGFEPLEAKLMARDPGLVEELESAFGELRGSIADGVAAQEFAGQAASLDRRLRDAADTRAMAPFLAALLVVLREGVEASILIAALLAGARRLGRADAGRAIHAGWIAALPAGLLTWWVFERLMHLGPDRRELVEALVTLVAAAVLFSVSSWMISKTSPRRGMDELSRNLVNTLSARTLLPVAGLAFLAVYREAAETVLFLQAILFEARGTESQMWAGVAAALVLSFACAFVIVRAIARLPLRSFFVVSGLLLSLLAVSFAGSGIHTLVVSGYLKARPVRFPEIPWMGIHPDLSVLMVQLAIAATLSLGAYLTYSRRPSQARPKDGPDR